MVANGASAADVGYVFGLTTLPWTLKLVNSFIMDRYTFLAMGRRRIWIIGAQLVMIALLAGGALIGPGVTDILLLGIAGFVVNMATTFEDVAVDGMAVDIMEEEERARASAMMFGGQSIGIAAATALSGLAIARLGPAAAYLLSAGFIGAITLYLLLLTERAGERRVPWSAGDVHPRNRAIHVGEWWPILKSTAVSMIRPVSLFWLPVLLVRGSTTGCSPRHAADRHRQCRLERGTRHQRRRPRAVRRRDPRPHAGRLAGRQVRRKEIDHRHVRCAVGGERGDVVQRRQLE
jgi:PAT family beta-lactamase induction signal transducer AmpG